VIVIHGHVEMNYDSSLQCESRTHIDRLPSKSGGMRTSRRKIFHANGEEVPRPSEAVADARQVYFAKASMAPPQHPVDVRE